MFDAFTLHVSCPMNLGDGILKFCADDPARWNSTLFTSIPFIQLPVAVVTSDFLQFQGDWDASNTGHFSNDAL